MENDKILIYKNSNGFYFEYVKSDDVIFKSSYCSDIENTKKLILLLISKDWTYQQTEIDGKSFVIELIRENQPLGKCKRYKNFGEREIILRNLRNIDSEITVIENFNE